MKQLSINDADCYYRKGAGTGFYYCTSTNEKISDESITARLDSLAVPPAYNEEVYSPYPDNYLQAIATDAKGRLQYFYHPDWREKQELAKFDHLTEVLTKLPLLRRQIESCLSGFSKSGEITLPVACAAAAYVLDTTYMRIGSAEYAADNSSYGLSTIRRKHVTFSSESVTFSYPGKSGVDQVREVSNNEVATIIQHMNRLSGYEVFCYREGAIVRDLTAGQINQFIKDNSGSVITAKDFRTWHAGVEAITFYQSLNDTSEVKLGDLYQYVADRLGNTPSVTHEHYIHPKILEFIQSGKPLPTARKSKWLLKEEVIVKKIIK